ncbi:MAG: outer membrane protein assembly factor BamA, partial [Gemmataceae bacterium]|nr:outer membrane protein assembly factor BamA [Gemmataceae bacterium]
LPAAVLAAAALLAGGRGADAADTPVGRVIADVVPVNLRNRGPEQVLNQLHTRKGKVYDEGVAQEDIRRLLATKWFVPGGVQVHTKIDPDGKVTVFLYLTELTSTVQEIHYLGAEHLSQDKLRNLTGLRRGEPMNPLANELGRQAILREYLDDGRAYATVELVEGNSPADTRVVYRVVEGPKVKVRGVEFRGNRHATTGRLRTQLATKSEFLGFMGGRYNPQSIDADLKKLTEYYHGLGHLAAKITPEVVPAADPGHVTVVYHVEEGPVYQVGGVQIDGLKSIPTEQAQGWIDLKPGQRYDGWVARRDMKTIEHGTGDRGHRIGVEQKLYEDPNQPGVARVHYEVRGDAGRPDRVGQVTIEGNTITQDRVIMNQLGIYPGQILQYPRLEDARMRLARLGIFDPNNPPQVEVVPNELDSDFKDVRVVVNETQTGNFMIGGSVNSNAGLNGNITLHERNFDLFRFPRSWDDFRTGRAFRGAGQELQIVAQPGTQFQSYSATFREPYLFDTPFGLSNSVYYFTRNYAEYDEKRVGDRLTIDRRLDPIWRLSGTVRVEGVNVSSVPFYAPPSISDDIGWSFLLGLRAGITRDTRDSFITPTKGSVLDVGYEQVLGNYTFPIGTAEFTKFFSSEYLQREDGSGKHVLAVRSALQVAGANAPVFERFYAGGFRSMRGFSFRGVGPTENSLKVGGTFAFLNTLEYQVPILQNDKLYFVTFLDHGTVESDVSIRDYRVAAGFGFRIAVPALGPLPIALDFAFPLNQNPWDNRQMFSFSVGMLGGAGR